jgi:hypothetical protein
LRLRIWTGIISLILLAAFFPVLYIAATAEAASVHIAWPPSDSPEVAGYRVHYGDQPGFYTNTVQVDGRFTSDAVIGGLEEGKTYFFAITAYTANGSESGYSKEISNEKGGSLSKRAPPPSAAHTASRGAQRQAPQSKAARRSAPTQETSRKIPPSRREATTAEGKIMPSRTYRLGKTDQARRGPQPKD